MKIEGRTPKVKASPGFILSRSLIGHLSSILCLAFDPSGKTIAAGSRGRSLKIWEVNTCKILNNLPAHDSEISAVSFHPSGKLLASGSADSKIMLWKVGQGEINRILESGPGGVTSLAFDPSGRTLVSTASNSIHWWEATSGKKLLTQQLGSGKLRGLAFNSLGSILAIGSSDSTITLIDPSKREQLALLKGHRYAVNSVAFQPKGQILASGSDDKTIRLWNPKNGKRLRTLEGHTGIIESVAFSADGRLLASNSNDGTVRIWNCVTWEPVAIIVEPRRSLLGTSDLAFHPTMPLLAIGCSFSEQPDEDRSRAVHIWSFDIDVLLKKKAKTIESKKTIYHTTAKIVLVGDAGVGKTGLGWRLANETFKEHASTHGQKFWLLKQLCERRQDGTDCEAILWDLAGQPDYRLIHALFLDDADLVLLLFDPSDRREPLHGVEFWLKQLRIGGGAEAPDSSLPVVLVGARSDRGTPTLTEGEISAFCKKRGINDFILTSALTGEGLPALLARMKDLVRWDDKAATVTTNTFKRIKDFVLSLKERHTDKNLLVTPIELRRKLEGLDDHWQFTNAEMMTAVGHLENYGYVKRLRTSKGEEVILLSPELLNNLAASLVLEARRNPKGLGSIEEKRLLAGAYQLPELTHFSNSEREILLDSVALMFLEHLVCFRETDPLTGFSYLVFPELINLKKPALDDELNFQDGMCYTISGAIENVYASLVVLLGYTQTFTRADQWRQQARYEVSGGLVCGFRQDADRDGEMDLSLFFGKNVNQPLKTLFQGLFESFLGRRNLTVFRYEPVVCNKCKLFLDKTVLRDRLRSLKEFAFCSECGEKLSLPKVHEPIQLTQQELQQIEEQQWFATQRSRFEQAIYQVLSYAEAQKLSHPDCFVSYAWGNQQHERWVERNLAIDLQKAGIKVVLDRWENSRFGSSVVRFVERVQKCNRVLVVGTPLYKQKYENKDPMRGFVVAAEADLIGNRMIGTESEKESVLPLLLEGTKESSFPPLLQGRVYADFRDERDYFMTTFDLVLSIYRIERVDKAVADLRETLSDYSSGDDRGIGKL